MKTVLRATLAIAILSAIAYDVSLMRVQKPVEASQIDFTSPGCPPKCPKPI